MGYNKNSKELNYMEAANAVTLKELHAMAEFIRNFKLRYANKKVAALKKKKDLAFKQSQNQ